MLKIAMSLLFLLFVNYGDNSYFVVPLEAPLDGYQRSKSNQAMRKVDRENNEI